MGPYAYFVSVYTFFFFCFGGLNNLLVSGATLQEEEAVEDCSWWMDVEMLVSQVEEGLG